MLRIHLHISPFVVAAAIPLLACAPSDDDPVTAAEDDPVSVGQTEMPIIGGTTLSLTQRRALGLVDISTPLGTCSGALITPDWVITATHCLDLVTPSNNQAGVPRTDGVMENRVGGVISSVGATDISVMSLQSSNTVTQWPTTIRKVLRTPSDSQLIGQAITCYGHGSSAYKQPSGLAVDGLWRSLTKTIASFDGNYFVVNSNNGDQILAPGDSGGVCLSGGNIVGVASQMTTWSCANPSTTATCRNTITKIDGVMLTSAQPYADYIDFAASRSGVACFAPLTLASGWTRPFSTNNAGYTVISNTVYLRGAIRTDGTGAVPFTLPVGARPNGDAYVPIDLCNATKGRLYIQRNGTTTVQAEGGASGWPQVQCFTSLDGVSFVAQRSVSDEVLMLQNGWSAAPYNTRAPAVRIFNGVVHLSGAMAGGSTTGTAFLLPAFYRPATVVYLPVDLCNATKGRLVIQPTGEATVQAEGASSNAQCFTSLDGASFTAATQLFPLTALNGWIGAPYGTRAPAAMNLNGIIHFQGAVGNFVDPNSSLQILRLPELLRPVTLVYVPVDLCNATKGGLVIQPDGFVYVEGPGDARCFTSLEGASFGL